MARRNLLYDAGNTNKGSVTTKMGGMGWEEGRRLQREGTCVDLC